MLNIIPTTQSRVLLEKQVVTQIVKEVPPFMKPTESLSCSQEPATGLYPQIDGYSPHFS